MFTVADCVRLYNLAFGASIDPGALGGNDPIVARIARHIEAVLYSQEQ